MLIYSFIHQPIRDVDDALTRLQEKYSSLIGDIPSDMTGVTVMSKKHEQFERELAALEGRVRRDGACGGV